MNILYNTALVAYRAAAHLIAPFSPKAARFVAGRKGLVAQIENTFKEETRPVIWLHCASLGEFEQGRPVLEALREKHPDHAFLLTFFSPSGYEVRKNYAGADYVFYLPHDTPENARRFVAAVKPVLALMVKYDLWLYYLQALQVSGIPVVLFAARFTSKQGYFKWYGGVQREMLRLLSHIFVQDEDSRKLLFQNGFSNVSVAGDTRFDRVAEAAEKAVEIPEIQRFSGGAPLLIAGSTWPQDEGLLAAVWGEISGKWKLVIVPHEVDENHLQKIESLFVGKITRWTKGAHPESPVLLVDTVGMLLQLYQSAAIAYVGGGFGKAGIHNVLEPAAMGAPVLHGPIFHQFLEAQGLIDAGGAGVIHDTDSLKKALRNWMENEFERTAAGEKAAWFVQENTGATKTIVSFLEKEFLKQKKS